MNQTTDITNALLSDPPEELKKLMTEPRVTDDARDAVSSISQSTSLTNGTHPSNGMNGLGDGRLQVVNEHQEFTLVHCELIVLEVLRWTDRIIRDL